MALIDDWFKEQRRPWRYCSTQLLAPFPNLHYDLTRGYLIRLAPSSNRLETWEMRRRGWNGKRSIFRNGAWFIAGAEAAFGRNRAINPLLLTSPCTLVNTVALLSTHPARMDLSLRLQRYSLALLPQVPLCSVVGPIWFRT